MKDFLETNYNSFISKIKSYIETKVKMDMYKEFWRNLDIKLQIKPLPINGTLDDNDTNNDDSSVITNYVKPEQISDDNDTNNDDCDTLIDWIKPMQTYWVVNGKVEENDNINRSDFISKKSTGITCPTDIGGVYKYELEWIITEIKNKSFVEQNIAGTLLKFIKKVVNSEGTLNIFIMDLKKSNLDKVSFMKQYYKGLHKHCRLPGKNLISAISYKIYEGRENKGVMCFVPKKQGRSLNGVVEFSNKSIDKKGFNYDNVDYVRKMLEMSKKDEGRWLLFDPQDRQCWGIISQTDIKNQKYLSVHFQGAGKWKVRYAGEEVLICNYNKLSLGILRTKKWEKNLLQAVENQKEEKSFFEDLINCLKEQKYGALVIIASDAEEETSRLCDKYKRGTKIDNANTVSALSMISGFCSIDGAVFIDWKGKCHGYGVILDGEAKVAGERGRGARYNSAANYIAGSQRYAIVVSEDKDKDIEFIDPEKLKII